MGRHMGRKLRPGKDKKGRKVEELSQGVVFGFFPPPSFFLSLLLLLLLPSLLLLLANWWTEWSKDTAENIGIDVEGRGSLQMRIPIRV